MLTETDARELEAALKTTEGREQIAQTMYEPFKKGRDYVAIGRQCFAVDHLPAGAPSWYDLDLNRVQEKFGYMLEHPKANCTVDLNSENQLDATMGNQQERLYAFGYLLGCYFGDGSISDSSKRRALYMQVIDQDFLQNIQKQASKLFKCNGKIHLAKEGHDNHQTVYALTLYNRRLFPWMKSTTKSKTEIPKFIYRHYETLKGFLEGVIDSEGSVNAICVSSRKLVRWVFQFSTVSSWTCEIFEMLRLLGCKTGNLNTYQPKKKNEQKRYLICIPLAEFAKTGLKFSIYKKQQRMILFNRILRDCTPKVPSSRVMDHDTVRTILRDIDEQACFLNRKCLAQ